MKLQPSIDQQRLREFEQFTNIEAPIMRRVHELTGRLNYAKLEGLMAAGFTRQEAMQLLAVMLMPQPKSDAAAPIPPAFPLTGVTFQ